MFSYVVCSVEQSFKHVVNKLLKNALLLFGLHWLQVVVPPLHTIQLFIVAIKHL